MAWYTVSKPEQLEAIASAGREEITDVVGQIGPCTIAELGRALGRSRHSLYYHVRALRDCGLIVESIREVPGAKATAYYDVPGRPIAVRFDLRSEKKRDAVIGLARARLRMALRGFVTAVKDGNAVTEGRKRDLWATHIKGWLSDSELEEANDLLSRLIDLIAAGGPREGKRPFELTFAFYPSIKRDRRRARTKGAK